MLYNNNTYFKVLLFLTYFFTQLQQGSAFLTPYLFFSSISIQTLSVIFISHNKTIQTKRICNPYIQMNHTESTISNTTIEFQMLF
jgi:hypothetical protein